MVAILGALKALADESRLRVVRLLLLERALNVGELTRILGVSQPSVSRAVGDLRRAGLLSEQREGGFVYYQLVRAPGLVERLETLLREAPDPAGDAARLAEILRERRERGAGAGDLLEPGRSWIAWARALRFLVPRGLRVADLGCGDGALTAEIASFATQVVAVERDGARLAEARQRLGRAGLANVRFVEADAVHTRLRAGSQDLVVLSQVLHHVEAPAALLAEAARILVRGGRALVLELAPHGEGWVQEKLGHLHLGFAPRALAQLLGAAGFSDIVVDPVAARGASEPFRVLVLSGVKA